MNINIERIAGNWDLGYSLDKHVLRSIPIGENQQGYMQFDTTRSEVGESLFKVKYRADYSQIPLIAKQLYDSCRHLFSNVDVIIPMPPSKSRNRQPVVEIAQELARLTNTFYTAGLLVKTTPTPSMKDLGTREEKITALTQAFTAYDVLNNPNNDVLIIDDLFDTGSSLEAATAKLRHYNKIKNIYVLTVTRKR